MSTLITFVMEASNFAKAAEIEKCLKEKGLVYSVDVGGNGTKRTTKRTPQKKEKRFLDSAGTKEILGYIATHRDETNRAIGKRFGWSENTIWSIRHGKHKLAKAIKKENVK